MTLNPSDRIISRGEYINKLHGFWLGVSIANWTGLLTETDRWIIPFIPMMTGAMISRRLSRVITATIHEA